MKVPLAWRILTYDKRRTALALVGIFMAILLVFVELGFFYAVPRGGLLLYDNMRFDLLFASDQYEYQAQPGTFPLGRLAAVRNSADVQQATPIYFGYTKWKSGEAGIWPDVFVIGFDPASHIFLPDSINRQTDVLGRADTVLVDRATRPMFGPLDPGRVVEIDDRKVTIGGIYELGTGFMGSASRWRACRISLGCSRCAVSTSSISARSSSSPASIPSCRRGVAQGGRRRPADLHAQGARSP